MAVAINRCFFFALFLLVSVSTAQARSLPDFVELVEDNYPAVVNISTTRAASELKSLPPGTEMPDFGSAPFGELLRKFFEERGGNVPPRQEEAASLGSGFIISNDGYVLTNAHVVDGADEIIVRLHDRRQLVAELIGTDVRSDIALLKIDAEDLPTVTIGKSDALRVGEWVLAIGSPFGFDHSVTAGIVSAKGRALPSENYTPFIQTDVAINPGNSGGPLFNLKGEVVGINSQIYSRTGGFMGLSFSIPVELAMDVVDQLKNDGHVSRGWLGVIMQEVTRNLAESFGMDRAYGALVTQILPDSPALNSELEVGDVIIRFNGKEVERSSALPPLVGRARLDEEARVEVVRNGKRKTLRVKIGELPEQHQVKIEKAVPEKLETVASDRLNITIKSVEDALRKRRNTPEGGVLVAEVGAGAAQKAGVRQGDIILSLDNQRIKDVPHFEKMIADIEPDRTVAVLIKRDQGPIFLAIKLPAE